MSPRESPRVSPLECLRVQSPRESQRFLYSAEILRVVQEVGGEVQRQPSPRRPRLSAEGHESAEESAASWLEQLQISRFTSRRDRFPLCLHPSHAKSTAPPRPP